ncbi:hypothetical protein [Kribbella lupini]|uniref:Uncharacterized protein n=1 Tax=Kribbella lupini TaxID=291602 RepID=A0ABP4LB12_9ACTN
MSQPVPSESDPRAVVGAVVDALHAAPAFHRLPDRTRTEVLRSLGQIGGYVGAAARGLAGAPLPRQGTGTAPAPGGSLAPGGSPAPGGGGTVGRVGEVARATLNAIDFPSFVGALIKGTFQAIVDATIQQLEAYATLLQEVAKTVDDYMQDNVTEDSARDYLAERYPGVLYKDVSGTSPTLEVDLSNPTATLPTFFTDLGFDNPAQIDPVSVDEVLVPAARKTIAEQRHQTLATMVLLGLNRIVVDTGEINAKLQFHIDAAETMALKFDSTQTSMGTMAGTSGRSTFSGNGIMVNTANINAQSDINVRTDLTGEVKVVFSSDFLPLERFADSNAIQLINQHATVPAIPPPPVQPAPVDGTAPATPAPQSAAVAPQSVTAVPVSPAPQSVTAVPVSPAPQSVTAVPVSPAPQSVAATRPAVAAEPFDPWAPRS